MAKIPRKMSLQALAKVLPEELNPETEKNIKFISSYLQPVNQIKANKPKGSMIKKRLASSYNI